MNYYHHICNLSCMHHQFESVPVDLKDSASVESAFRAFKPTCVVHCAAERRPDICESDDSGAVAALNESAPALLVAFRSAHRHRSFKVFPT